MTRVTESMPNTTNTANAHANAPVHASASAPASSPSVVIKRQSRVYRNGKYNHCMIIPNDVLELLHLENGEILQVTATTDGGGRFCVDRADAIGGGR